MRKSHLNLLLTGITALFLLSACSEESSVSQDDKTKGTPEPVKISKTEDRNTKTNTNDSETLFSVMNEPVDFSTPENVEKTVARIRSEEGEAALADLKRAMKSIWRNDTTVGKSRAGTYEEMDGKTSNEIINLAKQ